MAAAAAAELKIPVFTVIKNGAILKNVFIVGNPPPADGNQRREEVLVVGRHHDCDIVLTHPSVSRFHLHIRSDFSSQKLSVMDLSSVHGTFVSDKRIEPREMVELNEGDMLKVGGSSRVYRLHWIHLSQEYEPDQSFVAASHVSLAEGKYEECPEAGGGEAVEMESSQVEESEEPFLKRGEEHSPSSKGEMLEAAEVQSSSGAELEEAEKFTVRLSKTEKGDVMSSSREDDRLLDVECEKLGKFEETLLEEDRTEFYQNILTEDQENYSLDIISGVLVSQSFVESSKSPAKCETRTGPATFEDKRFSVIEEDEALFSPSVIDPSKIHYPMRLSTPTQDHCWSDDPKFADENGGWEGSDDEFLAGSLNIKTSKMDNLWSSGEGNAGSENMSSLVMITAASGSQQKLVEDNLQSPHHCLKSDLLPPENHTTQSCEAIDQIEQKDTFSLEVAIDFNLNPAECSTLSEVICRYVNKEIQPTRSPLGGERLSEGENLGSPQLMSATKSSPFNVWSRRGKPATALRVQTGNSTREKTRTIAFKSEDGKNSKVYLEDNVVARFLFPVSDEEEEIFTPDKENMTPNMRKLKFMKEIGKTGAISRPLEGSFSLDKIRHRQDVLHFSDQENQASVKNFKPDDLLSKSSMAKYPSSSFDEDSLHSSDKENQTPESQRKHRSKLSSRRHTRLVKEITKGKERVPFESLYINSEVGTDSSGPDGLFGNTKNNTNGDRKKTWIMVADTSSFLDKELKKSLQLLQGLRGTQLVIPRIVLNELNSLKRQHSCFRRNTEVSSVLEWIEEIMLNSSWWIHVQSSAEESWAVAPTPRASPISARFSFTSNPVEIVSPTTEDCILEYALLVRERNYAEQIVLLSNDTSLKIKAMAEGLLCETPAEFSESLVSPFSQRFMWKGSRPIGKTWSFSDGAILKEHYSLRPFKKTPRGDDAKGLKLILHHNSQYGQMKPLK